jgi:hypothetical protein
LIPGLGLNQIYRIRPSFYTVCQLIYIPDAGSWLLPIPDLESRIPDPKTATKERGEKKLLSYFFVITNFTKLNIILFLKCWEKNLGQFSKNYWSFYPKSFNYALKNMGLGSEIRDPEKTYPGSRGQKGTGSRTPDPYPQHCDLCKLLQGLMCGVNMPEGTNYLPLVHVYGFSKADDPAVDVKSR